MISRDFSKQEAIIGLKQLIQKGKITTAQAKKIWNDGKKKVQSM